MREGSRPGPCGGAEQPALLQKQVCEGQYGPGMAELEQQIAEHNILQKEIEAYGQQLRSLIGPVGELSRRDIPAQVLPQPLFHPSEPELGLAGPLGQGTEEGGTVGPGCGVRAPRPTPCLSLGLRFLPCG